MLLCIGACACEDVETLCGDLTCKWHSLQALLRGGRARSAEGGVDGGSSGVGAAAGGGAGDGQGDDEENDEEHSSANPLLQMLGLTKGPNAGIKVTVEVSLYPVSPAPFLEIVRWQQAKGWLPRCVRQRCAAAAA